MPATDAGEDISFIVYGQLVRQRAGGDDITAKCLQSIRSEFPAAEIILSTLQGQPKGGLHFDRLLILEPPVTFQKKSTLEFEHQIECVRAGLADSSRTYSMLIRADSVLKDARFCSLPLQDCHGFFDKKIRISNFETLNPLKTSSLFHLSHQAQFALREDLKRLWSAPGDALEVSNLRSEQIVPMHFLKGQGLLTQVDQLSQLNIASYQLFEKFVTENFEVVDWMRAGISFRFEPSRENQKMFLKPEDVELMRLTPQLAEARFRQARFEALIQRYPRFNLILRAIRAVQIFVFAPHLKRSSEAQTRLGELSAVTARPDLSAIFDPTDSQKRPEQDQM